MLLAEALAARKDAIAEVDTSTAAPPLPVSPSRACFLKAAAA
jgi:hypothetical protein